jgi:hypothetical protein
MDPAGIRALAQFDELRRFVLEDLERIVGLPVGGNFAVAALVGCSYDLLGKLQGRRPHEVFAESLPEPWPAVSRSLYDALRNGLVHTYSPKLIEVGDGVRLAISWNVHTHLTWKQDHLVLRAPDLVDGLRERWTAYEQLLQLSPMARAQFAMAFQEQKVRVGPAELAAWSAIISQ